MTISVIHEQKSPVAKFKNYKYEGCSESNAPHFFFSETI